MKVGYDRYQSSPRMELLRYLTQVLAIRRLKKTLLGCVVFVVLVVIWWNSSRARKEESAIGCKSKIAQIVFPKTKDKQKYVENFQHDVITMENEFYHFVQGMTRNCYTQVRAGPEGEGSWHVCLDPQFDIKPPCLIYSFGVGDEFVFEKAAYELFNCEIHAFDPSMGLKPHQFQEEGYFHDVGIDSEDTYALKGAWRMRKLKTLMKELGHEGRTIDYLKMDVEFSEWPALVDILRSGVSSSIRQMALELHTPEMDIHTKPDHKCTWTTPETLQFMTKTLFDLHNAGFSVFYSEPNYRTMYTSPYSGRERYCCYNIHMVNTKFQDRKSRSRRT